ncbi:putative porin [Pseudoalteromonas sp. DL2-H2.2]|uniref:putative porin n=1 Tax=Pseudoalteromonas sp. DL2-H2.2 TaxID=2908889 RepID=UPI001F2F15DF|nr:putative porin [Pseudoalteromonas sp. DL2-H2.2]MCF2908468.1 putative porin [Pseudoalteromonas sp. DL2-H2.2]
MKKLLTLAALAVVSATSAHATETKQWFNSATYTEQDRTFDNDALMLSSRYFFAPQQSSGVWDDYGYLDTDSNVGLRYYNDEFTNRFSFAGEGYFSKEVFVVGQVSDLGEIDDHYTYGVGYLYNDKLKLSVRRNEFDLGADSTWLKAEYNHQLNDTDYLGVTIDTDDEMDNYTVSGRYFMHLDAERYISVDVSHHEVDLGSTDFSYNNALVNFYFNRNIAVGVGSYDSDLALEGKYFFNDSYYLRAQYIDRDAGEETSLQFVAQF